MKKNNIKQNFSGAAKGDVTRNISEDKSPDTPVKSLQHKQNPIKNKVEIEKNDFEPWRRYYRGYEGL